MAELEQRGDRTPIPAAWEYASAPESREIVKLEERYGLFIGGEFVEPRSGEHYKTLDPSSEEPLAEIPQAGPEDVALAVGTARPARRSSSRTSTRSLSPARPRSARRSSASSPAPARS